MATAPVPATDGPVGAGQPDPRPLVEIELKRAPRSALASLVCWIAAAVAVAAPLIWLDSSPLDVDESVAIHYASEPDGSWLSALRADRVGPPLWPLLTRAAFRIGGIAGARMLSAAVLGLGTLLAFRLGRRLFGLPAGAAAALLLAGSPTWLRTASHAGDPLAPWLTESLAGLTLADAAAAGALRGKRALLAALALGAVAGFTEPRTPMLLMAQLTMVMPLTPRGSARRAMLPCLLGYALGWLPALADSWSTAGGADALTSWPTWAREASWFTWAPEGALRWPEPRWDWVVAGAWISIAIAGWLAPGPSGWLARGIALGGILMPFVIGAVVAALGLVRLEGRFLLATSTAAAVLAGRGLLHPIRNRWTSPAWRASLTTALALALMLPVALPRLMLRLVPDSPPFAAAARQLARMGRSGEIVVLDAPSSWIMPWYWVERPRDDLHGDRPTAGSQLAMVRFPASRSTGPCALLRHADGGRFLSDDGLPAACAGPVPGIEVDPIDSVSSLHDLFTVPGRKWLVWSERADGTPLLDPRWGEPLRHLGRYASLTVPVRAAGGTVWISRIDDRFAGEAVHLAATTASGAAGAEDDVAWPVFTTRLTTFFARLGGRHSFTPRGLGLDGRDDSGFPVESSPPAWWISFEGRARLSLQPSGSGADLELVPVIEPGELIDCTVTPRGTLHVRRYFPHSGTLWVRVTLAESVDFPLTLEVSDRSTGQHATIQLEPHELEWMPASGYVLRSDPGVHELEIKVADVDVAALEQRGRAAAPLRSVSVRLD